MSVIFESFGRCFAESFFNSDIDFRNKQMVAQADVDDFVWSTFSH